MGSNPIPVVPLIVSDQRVAFCGRLRRRQETFMSKAEETVSPILRDIARRGDRALLSWTAKLDGVRLKSDQLAMTLDEIRKAANQVPESLRMAFEKAIFQVSAFHRRQIPKSWEYKRQGARLGQRVQPLDSVGVYVPGGRAAYPSSILMAAVPAKIAGVKRIVVVSPPGSIAQHPEIAAVLSMLGIQEVYRVGGAQAIAALAYGTESIAPVDKIVGPGNAYVAAAKRMVFGRVDIDMIAGPTEIVIVADRTVSPEWIAADMLSQAEHDVLASAVCITDCRLHAVQIQRHLADRLQPLPKKNIASRSLRQFGAVILAEDRTDAAEIVNQLAPEHLELLLENPHEFAENVRHAGAIFFGRYTPEAVGDYIAGPSHILPTCGTARFFSPLGVYDFVKFSSVVEYTQKRLQQDRSAIEQMAEVENLRAHAHSVRIRFKDSL